MSAALRVAVFHGPNLNLLGHREPEIYGRLTLAEIDDALAETARAIDVALTTAQFNGEGDLVSAIQATRFGGEADRADGILINPGAYTHTSIAMRDALVATGLPTVEVHLSNVYAREPFRHHSTIADIVVGRIVGFKQGSYTLGLQALVSHLRA